jgi:IPT/TIG domain
MGELMRFRQTRSPQRRVPAPESILKLDTGGDPSPAKIKQMRSMVPAPAHPPGSSGGRNPVGAISIPPYFASRTALLQYLTDQSAAAAGLAALDEWLAGFNRATATSQQPAVAALKTQVKAVLGNYLPPHSTTEWDALRKLLTETLYTALVTNAAQPSVTLVDAQNQLTRLLLVGGLVDLLLANPSPVRASADIWNALRWRTLVLPDAVIALLMQLRTNRGAFLARKPSFADLYITREEWDHYEAAEIASIENIMGRESKNHVHVLVNQTRAATTTDTSKTTTQSQDTTTTDQTQLQQQSSSDVSLAVHVDASVNTSGQYGPVAVTAHVGGSLDYSNNTANSQATTQSHETVARAVNSVVQSARLVRSVSTLSRDVNRESHKFDNTKHTEPVVGVYRWVDQIHNVELDKYPHRFLMEFEIPEPGAWTRWLHLNDTSRGMLNKPPQPFLNDQNNPLQASDLSETNYLKFAARYSAVGVSPPPGPQYVSTSLKRDMPTDEYGAAHPDWENQPVLVANDTTATVPSGYMAKSWTASIEAWAWGNPQPFLDIVVGSGASQTVTTAPGGSFQTSAKGNVEITGNAGITVGTVPVSIMTLNVWGWTINVVIECDPLPETISQWQNSTFDQILGAYNAQLGAYNNEKAGLDVGVTNLVDTNSTDQNAKTIKQELKRQVIEMLTGLPFGGRGAIAWDTALLNPKAPQTHLRDALQYAPEIQFLEQAFEWETMSYICYPYLWADSSRWKDLAIIQGSDQNFADFLRAGSARVVLAARPGFENQVNLYTALGILWGGGPAPAPGDADYLSIADEIKAQQQRPLDVSVIDAWQVRLPTTLIWLQNADPLPSNPSPTIIPRPSIISLVPEAAAVGATVTVIGACFGSTSGASKVTFNGTAATATTWKQTMLVVTVPNAATSGNVVVSVNGIDSNPAAFSVL